MAIRIFLLLMLSGFIVMRADAQTTISLAGNGRSSYTIIIPDDAGRTEVRAAELFRKYLFRISGAEIPVHRDSGAESDYEIIIGMTNRNRQADTTGLREDGYYIRTENKKLYISGGYGKGVIYGVTSFLEDYLGVRKYTPDAEYVPVKNPVVIENINDRQVPPADIRVIRSEFTLNEDYRDFRKLSVIADKWSGTDSKAYFVHTFKRLVPSEIYFDTHPEYFSLVNGKRIPHGQLCLSNPGVFEITAEKLSEQFSLHPGVKYWSVSQNDDYDYCTCEECRKTDSAEGSPSGSMIKFVNKIADKFPDKIITTLAYQYTRTPPLHIKPADNVMITLCTIELKRSLPIVNDPGSASFVRDIKGWSRICDNIMLWDYEIQFTNYMSPFPLFHTLQPNIRFFTNHGVKAHYQQCNAYYGTEFGELKAYLLSKLLWNPDADAENEIVNFCYGYYGMAGKYILGYLKLLHEYARESKQPLDIYGSPVWYADTFLSAENMKKYYELFEQAEDAARDFPQILERVKICKLSLQYADLEIAKWNMFGDRGWYEISNGKYILRKERKDLLEEFYNVCKRNKIVDISENAETVSKYYKNTLRFIDIKTEGNLAFQKPVTCSPLPAKKYSGTGPGMLTNGVNGTEDFKINWLGWDSLDAEITVDLGEITELQEVNISTLQVTKSWILHPERITMFFSSDGNSYTEQGSVITSDDLRNEPQIKNFTFAANGNKARYIKFFAEGTKILPYWHSYAGRGCWLFIDEITAK